MKKKSMLFAFFLLSHLMLLSNIPAYIIDFSRDSASITIENDQVIYVQGNVLVNDGSGMDAGFDYKITLTISGGPASSTPINFMTTDNASPAIGTAASKFDFNGTKFGTCGGDLALCYAFMGREGDIENDYVYLRDLSSKMVFTLEFDNGISMENVTYTLGDMDYNFIGNQYPCNGTGDMNNYNCCLLYTSPSPRDQRGSRMPSSA